VHAYGASGYDRLSRAVLVECVAATELRCSGIMPVYNYWTCAKKYVTRINRRSYIILRDMIKYDMIYYITLYVYGKVAEVFLGPVYYATKNK